MKFENTEVFNFEGAIRGARNPLESWSKSDSTKIYWDGKWFTEDKEKIQYLTDFGVNILIGENDLGLMQRLIKAAVKEGNSHSKFLRQIMVCVDITAPLYWWKEFDTYKVGTVANSTSTMHKMASKPITLDCFDIDDYYPDIITSKEEIDYLIQFLEGLRTKYLETKDKRYWKELIRWLPEGWLQTRTITLNYQVLRQMYFDRQNHKLNEWSGKDNPELTNFCKWVESLPYAKEMIFYTGKEDNVE